MGFFERKKEIILGDTYIDRVSGFKGAAVARHIYLNGCERVTIQPVVGPDMKLPECETFDTLQLDHVEAKKETGDTKTGGPEKYSDKRRY